MCLSAKRTDRGSALDDLRQAGAFRALFPRAAPEELQAVLINTAGGVTGGDDFAMTACAHSGACLSLTTQAAERAYRAQPGEVAQIRNRLFVREGARIAWLPQETILYDGCALKRSLSVELQADARLLLVEPLVFGRDAMGETLSAAMLHDRIDIRRGASPLYLDSLRLEGDITRHLASPHIANGAGALASVVYIAPDAESRLTALRALLPETGGASLLQPDLLALRLLGADSFDLRRSLVPILRLLSQDALPRSWMT